MILYDRGLECAEAIDLSRGLLYRRVTSLQLLIRQQSIAYLTMINQYTKRHKLIKGAEARKPG